MANECMAPAHISRCFGGVCGWCKQSEVTRLSRELDEARATNLTWLAKYNAQRGELAGVTAEVTRLTEALAAAERFSKDAAERHARDSSAYESRVRDLEADYTRERKVLYNQAVAAESECAALRAEVYEHGLKRADALRERNRLEQENETLREGRGEREAGVLSAVAKVIGLESRLAAANALLSESCPATHDPARCQEWYRRRDAHLAAQPATASSRTPELDPVVTKMLELQDRIEASTAPARGESELSQLRARIARAESILSANGGYWASEALKALREK